MLLTEAQAKTVFAGSFESTISALVCAAQAKGWSLISTKAESAHFMEGGSLTRRTYRLDESSGEVEFGEPSRVVTFPETDAVGIVAEGISRATRAILNDEPVDTNTLIALSRHAADYMSIDEAIKCISAQDLVDYYEDHKTAIRKNLWGRLGEIESRFGITNYKKFSASRADDIRDTILDSLRSCSESIDRLECAGRGQILTVLLQYKEQAPKASAILRHSNIPSIRLAEAADAFSKAVQIATILAHDIKEGN